MDEQFYDNYCIKIVYINDHVYSFDKSKFIVTYSFYMMFEWLLGYPHWEMIHNTKTIIQENA